MKNYEGKDIVTMYGCIDLLDKLVEQGVIQRDPNNKSNIIVYRSADKDAEEGWYTQNIFSAAEELLCDRKDVDFLINTLREKQPDYEMPLPAAFKQDVEVSGFQLARDIRDIEAKDLLESEFIFSMDIEKSQVMPEASVYVNVNEQGNGYEFVMEAGDINQCIRKHIDLDKKSVDEVYYAVKEAVNEGFEEMGVPARLNKGFEEIKVFNTELYLSVSEEETDRVVEQLWEMLEGVPFDETGNGEMAIAYDWHEFEQGTPRSEIWKTFDQFHSKGIEYLLYEYEPFVPEKKDGSKSPKKSGGIEI